MFFFFDLCQDGKLVIRNKYRTVLYDKHSKFIEMFIEAV